MGVFSKRVTLAQIYKSRWQVELFFKWIKQHLRSGCWCTIRHGKRGRDRSVPLSPQLLETLREYYRWMKPKTYSFPGTNRKWRVDKPVTSKVPWVACREGAERAGIDKTVSPPPG